MGRSKGIACPFTVFAAALAAALVAGCGAGAGAVVRSAPCGDAELRLVREREMVELSYRDVFHLYLKRPSQEEAVRLTGDVGVLPRVKRYRDMVLVEDFAGRSAVGGGALFTTHYVDPALFSREEFEAVARAYRRVRDEWIEIRDVIGALVYGHQRLFHEVFHCANGLHLYTTLDGDILITDDPSFDALTRPAENRHFDHVAFFDDENRLYLRTGRIASGTVNDLFGRPSRKVAFSGIAGVDDYVGHVDVKWVDLLYREDSVGIDAGLILSAVDARGRRVDEIFAPDVRTAPRDAAGAHISYSMSRSSP